MGYSRTRFGLALTALVLSAVVLALAAPAFALACEGDAITLPVIARGYYYSNGGTYLHFLDGVVTNDSSVTVKVGKVEIGWLESPGTTSTVWVGDTLAPGEWTTFHTDWPGEANAAWTVGTTAGLAYKCGPSKAIALTLDGVGPVNTEGGMRWYDAAITNASAVTVSGIDVIGREMNGGSFVDSLFSWDLPDSLAPGERAYVKVRGKATGATVTGVEMRFTAREKPTITLTPSTLAPVYGTPITFRIDLKRGDGTPATGGRTLKIYHSFDGDKWESDYFHEETESGFVVTQITPDRPTYYRAVYWGGEDLGEAKSEWMLATPIVANGAPAVPAKVRVKRSFSVSGRIGAGAMSAGKPVTVFAEKKIGRRWVRKVKVTTIADASGAYKKALKLSSRGTWRVRAYRPGVGYSKYRTVKVR